MTIKSNSNDNNDDRSSGDPSKLDEKGQPDNDRGQEEESTPLLRGCRKKESGSVARSGSGEGGLTESTRSVHFNDSDHPQAAGDTDLAVKVDKEGRESEEEGEGGGGGGSSYFNKKKKALSFKHWTNKPSFFERGFHWTSSLRKHATYHEGVGTAAFLLRDAILGVDVITTDARSIDDWFNPYSKSNHPLLNKISFACRFFLSRRVVRNSLSIAVWCIVLLSFVEPPAWCRDFTIPDGGEAGDGMYTALDSSSDKDDSERCEELLTMRGPPAFDTSETDNNVEYYPNSHITFLTVEQSLSIESVCVAVVVACLLLRLGRDGLSFGRYLGIGKNRKLRVARIVMVFSVVLLIAGMIWSAFLDSHRPLSGFFRILLFVAYSKDTRREIQMVLQFITELLSIMFLLLIVILFYGWIGVVAFNEPGVDREHFSNLIEACWSLWIMVTTANYPDVMMTLYNETRVTAIYFVSFMVITFFFLMNVVLASVVNCYNNEVEALSQRRKNMSRENVKKAFELLDKDNIGRISRETIMSLFLVLNEDFHDIRYIPSDEAEILFAVLDKDGSGLISEEEFMNFGTVLLLRFEKSSAYKTFIQNLFPAIYASHWFQKFCAGVKSNTFDVVIDIVLALNAVVVAIQSYPELIGETRAENPRIGDGEIDTVWEVFETIFTVLYCIEMTVKILVLGWKKYSESYRNLFDGFITVLSLFATCYVYYPNKFSDSRLIRYIVMARVLRMSRLLVALKPFRIVAGTFIGILPAARRVLLLLFCVMYAFSLIGMHAFGGIITRDPSNPLSYRLQGTDFEENEYWANNFNDMLSGMNVLFNLLVVNNWTEQADGFVAAKQSKLPRLFFLFFHIIGVVIANNLVVAFIINSFITEWDKMKAWVPKRHDLGENTTITDDARAIFHASKITGTKTDLSDEYIAHLRANSDLNMTQRSVLKDLFTQSPSTTPAGSERNNNA